MRKAFTPLLRLACNECKTTRLTYNTTKGLNAMFASYNSVRKPSSPITNRKVFANGMVAHVWAQQTNEEGRSNNGNFYFRGDTIFSYGHHFPIARFSVDKTVVWFTNATYSVSTSGHVS